MTPDTGPKYVYISFELFNEKNLIPSRGGIYCLHTKKALDCLLGLKIF